MKQRYFITGTDTDVGKTKVSECLLKTAANHGCSTLGLKPLAAGAQQIHGRWCNDDALALQAASTVEIPYDSVNPVLLKAAIAPHIAAEQEQRRLSVQQLAGFCRGALLSHPADFTLIEGAGGWLVPLNARETLADLVKAMDLDVILVVGLRLGCLNHALLSARAIQADGLKLAGWIANLIEPDMSVLQDNLTTLQQRMPAPMLGLLPHLADQVAVPENWVNPKLFSV